MYSNNLFSKNDFLCRHCSQASDWFSPPLTVGSPAHLCLAPEIVLIEPANPFLSPQDSKNIDNGHESMTSLCQTPADGFSLHRSSATWSSDCVWLSNQYPECPENICMLQPCVAILAYYLKFT